LPDLSGIHRSEKGQAGIEQGRSVTVNEKDRHGPVPQHVNTVGDFPDLVNHHIPSSEIAVL
jgi:hypothetical protein